MEDFASLLSRVASNDPSLVELDFQSWTCRWMYDIPANRAELVQRVVDALATNRHVKSLKLISRQLTEADIGPLAELLKTRDFEQLELGGNKLTGKTLFPALAVRDALRVLKLNRNYGLTALEHLSALSSLKELDLGNCDLSAVSLAGLQMPNLEVLNLSGNPLKTLPASLASLSNLKQLDVSECRLSEFPAVLLSLTQLEKLDISFSQLTSIPDSISALVNLTALVVSRCGLKQFPVAVTQLAHLEVLNLSRNDGMKRVPEEIGNLRSLEVLRLYFCGLTELPAALWTLAHLETLDLKFNSLTSLPGGIGGLSKLKTLDLDGCRINRLPREMQQLSFLEVLDINNTGVTHLPLWLASLRSLKELHYFKHSFGVAVDKNTLVTFGELAALVSESSDPGAVEELERSFEEMMEDEPLQLLRIANMHFAPRTPLRALCVLKCVAQRRVESAQLPAHIRDEIARAAGEATGPHKRARAE